MAALCALTLVDDLGDLPFRAAGYRVVVRIPGGGDWSNQDVEIERVVVEHENRLIVLCPT